MNNSTEQFTTQAPTQLTAGESLVYRRHIANLLAPALTTVLIIATIIVFAVMIISAGFVERVIILPYIILFTGLFLFFVSSYFFMSWIFWFMDVWVINNEQIIDSQLVTFWLAKKSGMQWQNALKPEESKRGLLASIFNFGDIQIFSAAQGATPMQMSSISNPKLARKLILSLIANATQVSLKPATTIATVPLGEKLVQTGLISHSDLAIALSEQAANGKRLGDILVEKGLIKKSDLVTALSSQHRIPEIDISRYEIDKSAIKHMSYEVANKYTAIPVSYTDKGVLVALAEPSDAIVDEIKRLVSVPVDFVVADENYIKEAIRGHYLTTEDSVY